LLGYDKKSSYCNAKRLKEDSFTGRGFGRSFAVNIKIPGYDHKKGNFYGKSGLYPDIFAHNQDRGDYTKEDFGEAV